MGLQGNHWTSGCSRDEGPLFFFSPQNLLFFAIFPSLLTAVQHFAVFSPGFPQGAHKTASGPIHAPMVELAETTAKFLPPTLSTFLQTEMKEASGHSWVWSVLKCNLPFLSTHGDGYNFHLHWRSYNCSA